jgi:predicted nucleic-acid-binding Zn-ribbon protein
VQDWYARFAEYLDDKKAGPLVCPICKAIDTFEPAGALGAPKDISPRDPQFASASCTDCGYSIFFDSKITELIYGEKPIKF